MTTEIKAIFFDIGGTLVAKTKYPSRDARALCAMLVLLDLDWSVTEFVRCIEQGQRAYKDWCERTMNELSIQDKWVKFLLTELDPTLVSRHALKLQQLWRESKGAARVREDVPAIFQEFEKRGYLLGTISHSTPVYLDEPGLADKLSVRIYTPEFGKRKPHPSLFIGAARQCGLPPSACAYVGDNFWRDVVGPREAGFGRVILMENSGSRQGIHTGVLQPDHVIHDLNELLQYFPHREHAGQTDRTDQAVQLLYDAALSTMHWDKERSTADEFFTTGRNLGFARFELNHQIPPEMFSQIDLTRFSIGSLHDPCPAYTPAKVLEQTDIQITSLDETRRRMGVDVVKDTIEQACKIGCRLLVVHPGRISGDHSLDEQLRELYNSGDKGSPHYEEVRLRVMADRAARAAPHLAQCMESLREIVEFTRDTGLSIGLENRFHYYELPVFDELKTMLDEFTQPWVGWQFDIGHLQVHDQLGLMNARDWLEHFSPRIVGVHLHDVIGIKDHQAPGTGEVDFRLIAQHLPLDCYRTLEVDKTLTPDVIERAMQYLRDQGCVFDV